MDKRLLFAIIVAGFSSVLAQIVVLREAISGFYGNELLLGIILGNWLLIIGIGAFFGKYALKIKDKIKFFVFTQVLSGVFAILMIFFIRVIRSYIAVPGELIGLLEVFFYSFIIIFPFCFLHGFQFPLMSFIFSKAQKDPSYKVGKVYIFDNLGDLLGGLVFSYFLIFIFNSFQAIYIVVFLNLLSAFLLSKRNVRYGVAAFTLIVVIFISIFNLQDISTNLQYPNQKVVFDENSIYGNLVVTEFEGQYNFFENGFPLFNTLNVFSNEEKIHYALLQADKVSNVLLISGGVSGTTNEVLKYDPKLIDYIELDYLIVDVGKEYTDNLDDPRINIINTDGRLFVKKTDKKYDAVIIDLPDPSSVQVNRFYTLEFFNEIKEVLDEYGVLGLSLQGGENYLSEESKKLNAALFQTLAEAFENIIIIPGSVNFFIASDKELDYNYTDKIEEKNIHTEFIENYISGKITASRIEQIDDAVEQESRINEDFKPISHYHYLNYWLSLFNFSYIFIIILIIILTIIVLYLIKFKSVPFSIFVTGFSGSSLPLIIIVAFQILYGYVYHQIGIIITAFMLGLLIGAYFSNKFVKNKKINNKFLSKFDFLMVLYAIILPLVIIFLNNITDNLWLFLSAQIIIPILTIIIGIIVGIEFPIALKLYLKKDVKDVGKLYGADLAGACIGAYIVSILLIPLLGIITVSLIVGGLNLVSGFWLMLKR